MIKSGLIVGAVMFFLVLGGSSVVSPLCAVCLPLFTGLAAGALAGNWERSETSADAIKSGLGAGAIAGIIALLAQIGAAVINALVLQNPQFNPGKIFGMGELSPTTIWASQLLLGLCIGVLNVALTAAFGAAGGAIWFDQAGKKPAPPAGL